MGFDFADGFRKPYVYCGKSRIATGNQPRANGYIIRIGFSEMEMTQRLNGDVPSGCEVELATGCLLNQINWAPSNTETRCD